MAHSLAHKPGAGHPVFPDMPRPRMAKADVRNLDTDWMEAVGRAIERAVAMAGLTKKQAAAESGVDDAEFGKWMSGGRRPQFDRLFAVEALRQPLVIALADLAEAQITHQISFHARRSA